MLRSIVTPAFRRYDHAGWDRYGTAGQRDGMARQTARGIARKWGVSPREARKHFAAGTTPDTRKSRRQKPEAATEEPSAPTSPPEPPIAARNELAAARAAVQRAITAEEFTDEDVLALRELIAEGQQLLTEWEETVAEIESAMR